MFLQRLYDDKLAQASYLIGCQATGEMVVIDPNRDCAAYIAAAEKERMRITHVTETHIHADFVSGARELAARTGAQLLLSGEGGADWQYRFTDESKARLLHDGDEFMVGNLRFEVLHTPGHTPEHICFLLTDTPASSHPLMIFTGDFVFVGDVGRPDLLERAAGVANTMETGARTLWHSLQRFRALPDYLQVWPGHGAGSACGKALGAVPTTTVGYEKLVNWGLNAPSEAAFVDLVLAGQPEPPAYFARMKAVNRDGPAFIGDLVPPPRLDAADARRAIAGGAVLVDLRRVPAFSAAHVAGAIGIALTRSFTTYAGSALSPADTFVFVTADESEGDARVARRDLALIGFDAVAGWMPASEMAALGAVVSADRLEPTAALAAMQSGALLLDVRNATEWDGGHVEGAEFLPFTTLLARIPTLDRRRPIVTCCQSGARSTIAASLLRRAGFDARDAGGVDAFARAGVPLVREAASVPV